MLKEIKNKEFSLPDGRVINIETGKLATQAHGSVVVSMGKTMLLATVVSNREASEGLDFLPLSVEYQEKYAATGRFPGGFFKREARPSEYEILIARLVDRALRPLFPNDYYHETQVLISLISAEKDAMPDALACLAASAAISVSDIPFNGPISEVRVAKIDGEFFINPSQTQLKNATIDIMVAASMENIVMVEGEMNEVSEEEMIEAIRYAHEAIKVHCKAQLELSAEVENSHKKREYAQEDIDEVLKNDIYQNYREKVYQIAQSAISDKQKRSDAFKEVRMSYLDKMSEEDKEEKEKKVNKYFHDLEKEVIRSIVLKEKKRLDGRGLDQIRPIWSQVDYLPMAHGSAIFTRGETQSLSTVTLGTSMDEQVIDGAVIEGTNTFILHYNFPPFSTGEVKPMRGTSRREIGHGNLAMRAIKPVIPEDESNPYTIRIVSDILESNGSSSMATVCAGTLALMDAGVKIKKPVSGIAMGLITDENTSEYAVLSDILGDEDHLGDMDFKVTGTREGITACQMDIKVEGLTDTILKEALEQAKKGRLFILDEMEKTISEPRADYKPHVPRIEKMTVPKEFIGAIIGPGGKVIQQMQSETNTTIVIEEVGDFGMIDIAAENKDSIELVRERIKLLTAVPEVGQIYDGKVKNIMNFGAFIEILPGKEGLLHISEIDWKRIDKVEDVLNTGDKLKVKLIDIDKKTGKLRLSRKVLLEKPDSRK